MSSPFEGLAWIVKAADSGNSDGQWLAGYVYMNGIPHVGIPKDEGKAVAYLERASVQGSKQGYVSGYQYAHHFFWIITFTPWPVNYTLALHMSMELGGSKLTSNVQLNCTRRLRQPTAN